MAAGITYGKMVKPKAFSFTSDENAEIIDHLPKGYGNQSRDKSFLKICVRKLLESSLDRMEENILVTTTKSRRYFHVVFDGLEHLPIHLEKQPNRNNDEGDIDPLFPPISILIKMVEDLKAYIECRGRNISENEENESFDDARIAIMKNETNRRMKNGKMMEMKTILKLPDCKAAKKKSRRPIDSGGYCRFYFPELHHHNTHLFVVRLAIRRKHHLYQRYSTPSPTYISSAFRHETRDSSSNGMLRHGSRFPLTHSLLCIRCITPRSTAPSATPHDTMFRFSSRQGQTW
ncbi:hypothetical protein H5410_010605 [Solanum commersonii]|uniref:Uncharacterized protein n=1 Tax=Solanum commersonii TaxID=4109 RepID=A0A9J6AM86_SOLCO|nr:hypothetical protein H5410_010605 [Solanum commersonii]